MRTALLILLLTVLSGCGSSGGISGMLFGNQSKNEAEYSNTRKPAVTPDGEAILGPRGEPLYEEETKSKGMSKGDEAAPIDATPQGVSSQGSRKLDHLNSDTFYVMGVVGLLVGALMIFKFNQRVVGLCVGGTGIFCFFAPGLIASIGPLVYAIVSMGLIAGVIYLGGKYVLGVDLRKMGKVHYDKLLNEGHRDEAMAARRASDPKVNEILTQASLIKKGQA